MADISASLGLTAETSQFSAGLAAAAEAFQRFMKNVNPERLEAASSSTRVLNANFSRLSKAIEEAGISGKALDKLRIALEGMRMDAQQTGEVSIGAMKKFYAALVGVGQSLDETRRKTGFFTREVTGLWQGISSGAIQATAGFKVFGFSMGGMLGAIPVAIGTFKAMFSTVFKFFDIIPNLINMIRSRILSWTASVFAVYFAFQRLISGLEEYSLEMRSIRLITGASEEELKGLEKTIFRLGMTFPITIEEVAKAAHTISDYGLTVKEMQPYLYETIKLSTTFGESTEKISDVLYAATRVFADHGKTVEETAGIIFAASRAGIMNLGKYADAFLYTAESAKMLGFNLQELSLLISLSSEYVFKGGKLGTQLRQVFSKLAEITGMTRGKMMNLNQALKILGITKEKIIAVTKAEGSEYARAKAFVDLFAEGIRGAGDNLTALAAIAKAFGVRQEELLGAFGMMQKRFPEFVSAMEKGKEIYSKLELATAEIGLSFKRFTNIILGVKLAIVEGLQEPFMKFVNAFESDIYPKLKPHLEDLGKYIGKLIVGFTDWLAKVDWDQIIGNAQRLWPEIEKIANNMWQLTKSLLTIQWNILAENLPTIAEGFEKMREPLQVVLDALADFSKVIKPLLDSLVWLVDKSEKAGAAIWGLFDAYTSFFAYQKPRGKPVISRGGAELGIAPTSAVPSINLAVNVTIPNLQGSVKEVTDQFRVAISKALKEVQDKDLSRISSLLEIEKGMRVKGALV